jgi:hypothetical protein
LRGVFEKSGKEYQPGAASTARFLLTSEHDQTSRFFNCNLNTFRI